MRHRRRGPHGPRRTARGALLLVFLATACEKAPAPIAATPTAAAAPAARNLAMGTGEAPLPEPFTPEQRLLDAARRGDRATLQRALERGVSIDAKDDLGRSALFLVVMDAHSLELARWLHSKGGKVDEQDVGGRTPLSFAAANGELEIVRFLVESGAAPDRGDVQKRTPLFHAALDNHREVVGFLLDRGADVNARDQFGDTPLIVACAKGHGSTAALLLQRGADPSLKDQEGRNARDRAAAGTTVCTETAPQ